MTGGNWLFPQLCGGDPRIAAFTPRPKARSKPEVSEELMAKLMQAWRADVSRRALQQSLRIHSDRPSTRRN